MGIFDRRTDYESAGLDVGDVDLDPVTQWHRWYGEAVAAGCIEPNAMALATVAADGTPDCRYVLVRGVDQRGFSFFTNLESAKAIQLSAHPGAALVFGWLELHRQVRVRGRVEPVPEPEADDYFASRPRASRVGAWASRQSSVLADRAALDAAVADVQRRFDGVDVPRPPFWGGYLVVPDEVELWQGRESRLHDRLRYRRVGSAWELERLSP